MKKILSWFIATTFAVLTLLTVSSCEHFGRPKATEVESVQVKLCIDSIVNPVFTTSSDILDLQKTLKSNAYIDSVFIALPEKTLRDVGSVVLKKYHRATKQDIVNEFLNNRQIYENLPKNGAPTANMPDVSKQSETITKIGNVELTKEATTTVTEAPPTRVGYSGAYKDTTINGKKAIIQTE